jgi:serine/threonine-protein kinase
VSGSDHAARLLEQQRARWERGDPARPEDFLAADPSLPTEVVLDLAYQEVLLRQQRGESPSLSEFVARFPALRQPIAQLFEIDAALGDHGPVSALPPLPGFRIIEVLGHGGMGAVFGARTVDDDREVAIKVLRRDLSRDPEAVARFRREAEAATRLHHPNICAVYKLGEHEGQLYLVMERVTGRTLHALLAEKPTIEQVMSLVRQIAAALQAVHTAGIVHRDIKPENVIVRDDGCVKVLDFGLARLLGAGAPLTRPGTRLGTLRYMSPEQLRGLPAGPASDVFSLGVVWHELATGRHPFDAATPLPARLAALLPRMLAMDAATRPTIDAVIAELDEL